MAGMDMYTGKLLSEREALIQGIRIILTTPRGSRQILRAFGSGLHNEIDGPITNSIRIFTATTEALSELTEFELKKTNITARSNGELELSIEGVYVPTGEEIFERVALGRI